jgi:muconolactone delta-isomerase
MKTDQGLFDSPEAEARAEARAEEDVRSGRLISHGAVRRWLQSWGNGRGRLRRPRPGD